jgi:hypothetical protein
MIRAWLERFAAIHPPDKTFADRLGLAPYLQRWFLWGGDSEGPLSSFLHCIRQSDSDRALHNHPWKWAVAIILAGGYVEERRVTRRIFGRDVHTVVCRRVGPGSINVIRSTDFHRVDLIDGPSWSLFIVGPKFKGWGFWIRESGEFLEKDAFIRRVRSRGGTHSGGRFTS